MKHWQLAFCYGVVLAGFTGYVMLDTFVLPSGQTAVKQANTAMFEQAQASTLESAETTETTESAETSETSAHSGRPSHKPGEKPDEKPSVSFYHDDEQSQDASDGDSQQQTDAAQQTNSAGTVTGTYSDENCSITLTEYYQNSTKIYVADVRLTSAEYLQTAFADDTYGKNVTAATSDIAAAHGAVFAVNGDFYGARESGYVIRNGVVYRDFGISSTDVLCIYADGHFEITNSGEADAQALVDAGVWQAFSFGPGLVENGSVTVDEQTEVGRAMASNPRTAIGEIDPLHYVFVVSDGRTSESAGLTLYQLANFMQNLGVSTAYNLDGGGSSTMYFQGQVVNNPTTGGSRIKERSVSDIVYIGT